MIWIFNKVIILNYLRVIIDEVSKYSWIFIIKKWIIALKKWINALKNIKFINWKSRIYIIDLRIRVSNKNERLINQ